jgi:acyl-homoserine-lactone acylase
MFSGTVLAFRDANLLTFSRGLEQWVGKAQASDIAGYREALRVIGNPTFHEVAVDRSGEAYYGELSAIPFITQEQLDQCVEPPIGDLLAQETTNVLISLDGSDSFCEWGTDPEAPEGSNLYGASALPQFTSTDYVGNSNNSYWLSDAHNPLEGFIPIMGPVGWEQLQQFLRTRIGHLMVEDRRQAEDDLSETPLFDLETLKAFMYNNRVYGAELNLSDVLSICQDAEAVAVQDACEVLATWDQKVDLDSRGAQVWKEFWDAIRDELGASTWECRPTATG